MLTPADYLNLYNSCVLTTDAQKVKTLDQIAAVAVSYQRLYQIVQNTVKVPWQAIAAIHYRESSQNFHCHLHNGDPLTARTSHVPSGRPFDGNPPFTWVESACDALSEVWRPHDWNIAGCLEFLERYNGLGYQRHGVNSPYLWDYTNQYSSGLFVMDGCLDPNAKEDRPGAVSIVKTLESKGFALDFSQLGPNGPVLH